MAEQDPDLRYAQLRAAAVAVLDAAAELPDGPEPFGRCLTALHRAVQGGDSPGDWPAQANPARHMVSLFRYEDREKFPIPLDEEAAAIRRDLDADEPLDRRRLAPDGVVVLTELRGMVHRWPAARTRGPAVARRCVRSEPCGQKKKTSVRSIRVWR